MSGRVTGGGWTIFNFTRSKNFVNIKPSCLSVRLSRPRKYDFSFTVDFNRRGEVMIGKVIPAKIPHIDDALLRLSVIDDAGAGALSELSTLNSALPA